MPHNFESIFYKDREIYPLFFDYFEKFPKKYIYINSKQIWDIKSMIKILYNMIDWSNWWFYKNEEKNIIWGGIDEFAIDKYGIEAYSQRNTDKNLFGQHPTKQVYQDLIVNHLMKEYF
jgi:hypothetical protein